MEHLSTAEIAQRYGVERKTVTDKWTKRPDFPAPAVNINRKVRRWRAEDIERWATAAKR